MHDLIYTLFSCLLWDICGIKSMAPFTPCSSVYCGIFVGSNPWSHLHPVLVSIVGYLWDQIHGPIYTLYLCLLWGQIHGPIYTLYFCLLWGQIHGPIYILYVCILGSNPWSHLHPKRVSVVRSNPWFHLHPVLVSIEGYLWDQIYAQICTLYCGVNSLLPFTPCTFVCCGVKSMV